MTATFNAQGQRTFPNAPYIDQSENACWGVPFQANGYTPTGMYGEAPVGAPRYAGNLGGGCAGMPVSVRLSQTPHGPIPPERGCVTTPSPRVNPGGTKQSTLIPKMAGK